MLVNHESMYLPGQLYSFLVFKLRSQSVTVLHFFKSDLQDFRNLHSFVVTEWQCLETSDSSTALDLHPNFHFLWRERLRLMHKSLHAASGEAAQRHFSTHAFSAKADGCKLQWGFLIRNLPL